MLEDRFAPANLLVTSNLDDGSAGTLRSIIAIADANNEADTITFQAGISTITLVSGQINLKSDVNALTITGPGVVLSGAATATSTNRLFNISVAGGNPTVTIEGMTLTGGNLSSGNGGAILINNEGLILNNVKLNTNKSAASGGAIAGTVAGAVFELNDVTATNNTATTSGGVIYTPGSASATITLNNSSFSSNTAATGSVVFGTASVTMNLSGCTINDNKATGIGGAISIGGPATTINTCTFSSNSAGGGAALTLSSLMSVMIENSTFNNNAVNNSNAGGAIRYSTSVATGGFTVRNCTFFGNSSPLRGGAVGFTNLGTGTAKFENCTFTGNSATGSAGGGAIGTSAGNGIVSLESCIVSENKVATFGTGPDFEFLGNTSLKVVNSLIGSTLGVSNYSLDSVSQSLLGLPPRLGQLGNNGGKTLTIEPLPGSPAINNGSNPSNLLYDQRGGDDTGPLADFPRTRFGATDIGAVEFNSLVPFANAYAPHVPPILETATVTVIYSDDSAIDVSTIDLNDVSLTGPAFTTPIAPITVATSGSGPSVTATYQFPAPAGGWNGLHYGDYTIVMAANQVADVGGANYVPAGPIGAFKVAIPSNFVVNELGDIDDMDPFNGKLTLREAIKLSNANSGLIDTITFDSSLFGQTIYLGGTEFTISDPFLMQGPGTDKLTISGNYNRRFASIGVVGGLATTSTMINDVTFSKFKAPSNGGVFSLQSPVTFSAVNFAGNYATNEGGVVLVGTTTVTFNDCTATANIAGTNGGAISTLVGTITINRSIFSSNKASGGGAIYLGSTGSITASRCTFAGNVASAGGAIQTISGNVTIIDSTIAKNSTTGSGGGIGTSGGQFTITNSTLSGNSVTGGGAFGGAINISSNGILTLNNSTITKNSAGGGGGGISFQNLNAKVTLNSSIVAQNSHVAHPDLYSSVTIAITVTANNSIIGAATDGDINLINNSSQIGNLATPVDAMLGELGDHGGLTQVHALLAGSPALDTGFNKLGLLFDQRGPGFPRDLSGVPDIGAFEGTTVLPLASATSPAVPPVTTQQVVTITYTDETGINTSGIGLGNIRVTGPAFAVPEAPTAFTIVAGSNGDPQVTVTYTFTPPGGSWEFPENGTYSIVMQKDQVFDMDSTPNAVLPGPKSSFVVALPATFVVNELGDIDDFDLVNGKMTLREALRLSNLTEGLTDTITFDKSLDGQSIILSTVLTPTDSVVITGNGVGKTIISGNDSVGLINIPNGASATLNALYLTKSFSSRAIFLLSGSLVINDCLFSDNHSTDDGVIDAGGNVTVRRTTFMNNTAVSGGTAIHARSHLAVDDCLFVNNIASDDSSIGGAINITGGSQPQNVVIRNSTFTGNKAAFGGAVGIRTGNGLINIQNCTIVGNTATSTSGGGGIAVYSVSNFATSVTYALDSTIVSGNFATASPNTDLHCIAKSSIVANFSLIGSSTGAVSFVPDAATTALLGQPPLVDSLKNNGGPTQTMRLLPGSPAIDEGSNPGNLSFDQRGTGYIRNAGLGVDIGAFEVQLAPPQLDELTVNNSNIQRSLVTSILLSFSETVTLSPGAFVLQRITGGPIGTIGVIANQAGNQVTLTFDNSGSITLDPGASLPDGKYQLTVVSDNITGAYGKLDGNNNGVADASPVDDVTFTFHRLFGDADGNGSVTASDFNAFRLNYGTSGPSMFDFDNDGQVSASDFNAFRLRYGVMI